MLFWSQRGVIEATAAVSPEAWLRHLDLLVTALTPDGRPLRHPPLTAEQVREAKEAVVLGARRCGRGRPSGACTLASASPGSADG